jgi:hypothetical protein
MILPHSNLRCGGQASEGPSIMIPVRIWLLGKPAVLIVASAFALLPDPGAAGQAPAGLPELASTLLPGVVNISTDRRVQSPLIPASRASGKASALDSSSTRLGSS